MSEIINGIKRLAGAIFGSTIDDTVIGGTTPADATFDDVTLSAAKHLLLPQHNDAVTPTLAFGDGDSGFYLIGDNTIGCAIAGVLKYQIDASWTIRGGGANHPGILHTNPSATQPNFIPNVSDNNTGIGRAAADQLSLIAGGVEGIRITEDTTILVNMNGWLAMAEQAGDPAALADHAFLYAKDVGGIGNMFVADAAADATQISSHNFTLFDPDPSEEYPWSFYAENKAIGKRINVDMAGAIRAIEVLTGQKFIHIEDIEKSVDLEKVYKDNWKRGYIKDNTVDIEVGQTEAVEMVEADEITLFNVEVVDPKTGKIKIVKQGKEIGENILGYDFIAGEVKPQIEVVWETHKVQEHKIKEGYRFDKADGKFYKAVEPTDTEAETAAAKDFVFTPPEWMKDKLKKD